jgi:hypothetical protein
MTTADFNGVIADVAATVSRHDREAVLRFGILYAARGAKKTAARFLDRQDTVVKEAVVAGLQAAGFTAVLKVLADTNGWVLR